jgi:hypothetical protein
VSDVRAEAWDVTRNYFEQLSVEVVRLNPHRSWHANTRRTDYLYLAMACSWMKRFDQTANVDLDIEFGFSVKPVEICFDVAAAYAAGSSVNAFPDIEVLLAPWSPGRPLCEAWDERCVRERDFLRRRPSPANSRPVDVAAESPTDDRQQQKRPRGDAFGFTTETSHRASGYAASGAAPASNSSITRMLAARSGTEASQAP